MLTLAWFANLGADWDRRQARQRAKGGKLKSTRQGFIRYNLKGAEGY